jgi:hypothetical protein
MIQISHNHNKKWGGKWLRKAQCLRPKCGHSWWPRYPDRRPKQCPECKSLTWDKPYVRKEKSPKEKKITQKGYKRFPPDSKEMYIANFMYESYKKKGCVKQRKPNLNIWAKDIQELMQKQPLHIDLIFKMIKWCNGHELIRDIITTPRDLIKYYDLILKRMGNTFRL